MNKESKKPGSSLKPMLFLVPFAVTAAIALIKFTSLEPVPTELPEKLAYEMPTAKPDGLQTAAPSQTPLPGESVSEAPSVEPPATPEAVNDTPAVETPAADTASPAPADTEAPSGSTEPVSAAPTNTPDQATSQPTVIPTATQAPNDSASPHPTNSPSTAAPTSAPSATPSAKPTNAPTATPSAKPTNAPTATPTAKPTNAPTSAPTSAPTTPPTAPPTETPGKYRDGTYTASAHCYYIDPDPNQTFDYTVEVTINIQGGDIITVNAVRKNDVSISGVQTMNEIFMDMAVNGEGGPGIPEQIIANNGAEDVDTVSGATFSSRAIINAAKSALQKATKRATDIFEPAIVPKSRFICESDGNEEAKA